MKSFISFHIFRHWIADVKIKTSIPLDQVIKKVVTPFNRSGSKRVEPPKFTTNISKVKFQSPHEVIFYFNSVYTITKSPNELKTTPNAVDLAMDLLLSTQARKHRGESIYHQFKTTNLRQHHSHQ